MEAAMYVGSYRPDRGAQPRRLPSYRLMTSHDPGDVVSLAEILEDIEELVDAAGRPVLVDAL